MLFWETSFNKEKYFSWISKSIFSTFLYEFNNSTQKYIKNRFLERNHGAIVNFIFRFVDIAPRNLSIYETKELNIIHSSKKYLESENIEESLKQILLINENKKFFFNFIEQANIYLEFKKQIEKVS